MSDTNWLVQDIVSGRSKILISRLATLNKEHIYLWTMANKFKVQLKNCLLGLKTVLPFDTHFLICLALLLSPETVVWPCYWHDLDHSSSVKILNMWCTITLSWFNMIWYNINSINYITAVAVMPTTCAIKPF